jgi:hypothetical protein
MLRFLLSLLLLFGLSNNVSAVYDVNNNCKRAWMLLMDLQIEKAKSLLHEELKNNPENYYAHYLDQTCDVFRLIINAGEKDYNTFVEQFHAKRKIMDGKDESSPYYLSCFAEMELQVAVFSVMHGSQFAGVKKGYAAYNDVYKNLKKYPQFKPNQKLDGFFNVAIANLPPFVKWAVSAFGVKVNIDKGFKILFENYQSQKNIEGINAETALYIILAAKINKTPEMLYDFTRTLDPAIANTFLHRYFRANIAYWSGKNDEGIKILQQTNHASGKESEILYNYMMGKMLLRKLDPGAEQHFLKYLSLVVKKEYLKEINYNLALIYLMKGDQLKYKKYCAVVKTQGMDLNERDREALYEAKLDYIPDVNLVKARLSLDGGYLEAYLKYISAFESSHAKVPAYEMEYHLLKGKYAAVTSNNNLASAEFRKTLELSEGRPYYFASEAALQLGEISQKAGQKTLAKEYYKKCVKLYKKEYYEYIEDKASKALNTL